MLLNNEWNKWHESTKQDNERKRSANETNAADMNMPHDFAKFVFIRWTPAFIDSNKKIRVFC